MWIECEWLISWQYSQNHAPIIQSSIYMEFSLFVCLLVHSPQGIAFRNIPLDKNLYAMVCSTSAKSSVRLINTTSFRDCLQFRCMKVITKYPQLLDVSILPEARKNFVWIDAEFNAISKQIFATIPLAESAEYTGTGGPLSRRVVHVSQGTLSIFEKT